MRQVKIAVVIILAIILQSSLRKIWHPFVYFDLPVIVVVYFGLQREVMTAIAMGAITGLASDALGSSLLGAGGFSKTLTAYLVVSLASRVNLDNHLARIPVLAGAAIIDDSVFILLHRLYGQASQVPFVEAMALKLIGTTVGGTLVLFLLDRFLSERAQQRRLFAARRQGARRSLRNMMRRRRGR